jgi:hypothetical protein
MPGLRRSAGRVARGWRGDTNDRDAELLAGFVARLAAVDLDEPRICGRLLDAGERAARRACDHAEETEALRVQGRGRCRRTSRGTTRTGCWPARWPPP